MSLPIDSILEELCASLQEGHSVVLKAPPGAGKTTGVPPAILKHCDGSGGLDGKQIWVIQPRRLAARSVASWLARSHGEAVGQTYGYHVRLDRKETTRTRIVSMTTGMFLRRMQSDPLLENVGCILIDEFHERSLDHDVALALTARLRANLREDLQLVVMSATLEAEPIARYLDSLHSAGENDEGFLPTICLLSEGRAYPVEVVYRPGEIRDRLENRVFAGVQFALDETDGDVLVFLPGVADIERTMRTLSEDLQFTSVCLCALHGSLSPKQQDVALRHKADARKVILATNIAETSVTVEGVTAVVDSGLSKMSMMDSRLGLSRLETMPISQASADQRAGRAGRTSPGICVRLWDKASNASRSPYDSPEIARDDLGEVVLMLAQMGENDLASIRWLTPPPAHSVEASIALLTQLEAIDSNGRITATGEAMAALPLHPRIAKFVLEANRSFDTKQVASAASLLSERDPFEERDRLSLVEKIALLMNRSTRGGRVETVRSVARQIERTIGDLERGTSRPDGANATGKTAKSDWSTALLAAYPDRVVLRRNDDPDRGRMVGGRGVRDLRRFDDTAVGSPLMLCYEVDGGGTESRVRAAVPVGAELLNPASLVDEVQFEFDPASESIRGRRVQRYLDVVLRETPANVTPDERTRQMLFEAALKQFGDDESLSRICPPAPTRDDDLVSTIMHRIALVNEAESDSSVDHDAIFQSVLKQLCTDRITFAQLRKAPWKDYIIGEIGYDRWQLIQREAPSHLVLPSGNRAAVHYAKGKPPWLAAKIQECFGWTVTPRILFGKTPVQLHLLGPNRRPQQITEDLSSFWANTYGEIRKELRRRYPKHYWPEDPKTARATHNGLKPQ